MLYGKCVKLAIALSHLCGNNFAGKFLYLKILGPLQITFIPCFLKGTTYNRSIYFYMLVFSVNVRLSTHIFFNVMGFSFSTRYSNLSNFAITGYNRMIFECLFSKHSKLSLLEFLGLCSLLAPRARPDSLVRTMYKL